MNEVAAAPRDKLLYSYAFYLTATRIYFRVSVSVLCTVCDGNRDNFSLSVRKLSPTGHSLVIINGNTSSLSLFLAAKSSLQLTAHATTNPIFINFPAPHTHTHTDKCQHSLKSVCQLINYSSSQHTHISRPVGNTRKKSFISWLL